MINLNDCDNCDHSVTVLSGGNGDNGTNGNTVLNGLGVPDESLGYDGDMYVDRNQPFNFYIKSGGDWVFQGQLKGVDGNGFLIQTTVNILSAELLQINTTHKELIPDVPTQYFISVVECTATSAGSTAYQVGSGYLYIKYKGTIGQSITSNQIVVLPQQLLTNNGGKICTNQINPVTGVIAGAGLELAGALINPTSGDLTMKINLTYHLWLV